MFKNYGKQFGIAAVSYTGYMLFGYWAGWGSPVADKLINNPSLFGDTISSSQLSWLISSIFLGAIFGVLPLGYLADSIGRKPILMIGAVTQPVVALCLALVKNINILIFLRNCTAFVIANIFVMNLVYLGEIASTEIRGMILGTTGIFMSLGMLAAFSIGPYVRYEVLNYVATALSLVYLVGIFFIPESPVFLIKKGRDEQAKTVLTSLNRKLEADKLTEMKLEIEALKQTGKWTQLFTVKCNRKALIITCLLYFMQQLSGIGPLLAYTTTIFEISGSSIPPHIATIIIGVVQLVSGLITPLFIERYGRKFLLLLSTLLTCLSLAVLSVYLNLDANGNPIVQKMKWLPLAMATIYFVAYSFGFGIIPATLVGEMFQLTHRGAGTSAVLFVNFTTGFATVHTFGSFISGVGINVAFIIFSGVCGVAFLFALVFVPETKGKSLMEVQKMLSR